MNHQPTKQEVIAAIDAAFSVVDVEFGTKDGMYAVLMGQRNMARARELGIPTWMNAVQFEEVIARVTTSTEFSYTVIDYGKEDTDYAF